MKREDGAVRKCGSPYFDNVRSQYQDGKYYTMISHEIGSDLSHSSRGGQNTDRLSGQNTKIKQECQNIRRYKFCDTESHKHLYCAWPETALLAKCEDRACQGTVAEKSAILADVEYTLHTGIARPRTIAVMCCGW